MVVLLWLYYIVLYNGYTTAVQWLCYNGCTTAVQLCCTTVVGVQAPMQGVSRRGRSTIVHTHAACAHILLTGRGIDQT